MVYYSDQNWIFFIEQTGNGDLRIGKYELNTVQLYSKFIVFSPKFLLIYGL